MKIITSNENAWESLNRIYPGAKASELEVSCSKTGRLQVKMFGQGEKTYPLNTEEKGTKYGTNEQRLSPLLQKGIIEEPQKSIQEDQEIIDDGNEDKAIREKITGNQERINALEKERK